MCTCVFVCVTQGGPKRLGNVVNNAGRDASSAQRDTEYPSAHSLESKTQRERESRLWRAESGHRAEPSGAREPMPTTPFALPMEIVRKQKVFADADAAAAASALLLRCRRCLIINQKYFSFN